MNKNTEKLMPFLDALWMLRWGVKFGDNDDPDFIAELDDMLEKIKKIAYNDGNPNLIARDIDGWVNYFDGKINSLPESEIHTTASLDLTINPEEEFNLNSSMTENARKALYEEIFSYIIDVINLYNLKSACLKVAIKKKEITDVQLAKEQQKILDFKNMLVAAHKQLTDRLEFITNMKNISDPKSKKEFQEVHHDERLFLNEKLDKLEKLALEHKIISFSEYVTLPTREIAADSDKQLHNQLKVDREKLDFIKNFIDQDLRDMVYGLEPKTNGKRPRTGSKH